MFEAWQEKWNNFRLSACDINKHRWQLLSELNIVRLIVENSRSVGMKEQKFFFPKRSDEKTF